MNKSDLVAAIAEKHDLTKADVQRVVDSLPEVIAKSLKKGESVSIFGLGTFTLRKRAARQGRNPQTGETIKIKASKSPAFKAAKGFKDLV